MAQRRGEVCGLRWSDLDVETGTLAITRSVVGRRTDQLVVKDTKGRTGRRIALDPETIVLVQRAREVREKRATAAGVRLPAAAFLFSDAVDGSTPWVPMRATEAFIALRDKAGLPGVRLHDLRHAAATQLLAAGVPLRTVSGRLGHATPSTTLNVYAGWLTQSDEDAARIMGTLLGRAASPRPDSAEEPGYAPGAGTEHHPRRGAGGR